MKYQEAEHVIEQKKNLRGVKNTAGNMIRQFIKKFFSLPFINGQA